MIIEKLRNNSKLKYFLLYSLISIAYGFIISELGPLIPFLAAKYGVLETAFGFFFMCRSIGFTIGNFSAKFMHKWFTYHHLAIMGLIGAAIPHIIFPFINSITGQGLCLSLASAALGNL